MMVQRAFTQIARAVALSIVLVAYSDSAVAGPDIPPDVKVGSLLLVPFRAAGAAVEKYKVLEIRGTWVRASVVEAALWKAGAVVWLNLAVIDQFALSTARVSASP